MLQCPIDAHCTGLPRNDECSYHIVQTLATPEVIFNQLNVQIDGESKEYTQLHNMKAESYLEIQWSFALIHLRSWPGYLHYISEHECVTYLQTDSREAPPL